MTDRIIHCPKCSSENVVFSKKRGVNVCEDCGYEFAAEKPVAPLRIFLSYGHDANEELVRRIKADLEKRGHDVWYDKTEIKFGDEWRRAITDGILQSNRVLSFLSKHSTRDPPEQACQQVFPVEAPGARVECAPPGASMKSYLKGGMICPHRTRHADYDPYLPRFCQFDI